MSKRSTKEAKRVFYSPAKRQKLDITVENGLKTNNRKSSIKKQADDIWGDDFKEEDLQEMDLVASQALSQMVNTSVNESFTPVSSAMAKITTKTTNDWHMSAFNVKSHIPSPKKSSTVVYPKPSTSSSSNQNSLNTLKSNNREPVKCFPEKSCAQTSQDLKINHFHQLTIGENTPMTQSNVSFRDFERNLRCGNHLNSTVLSQNSIVVVPDDAQLNQISKLKEEYEKMHNKLLTKEGEVSFLRQQIEREQNKLVAENLKKNKLLEEQANSHKSQLMNLKKEKESLSAELKFKTFEMNSLIEKTKLLEKGNVKFVDPQSANFDSIKKMTTINRTNAAVKVQRNECATQVEIFDKIAYKLADSLVIYPLKQMPESVFESSELETPIIDIHINKKIGKSNLPILQEADNLRIFENPELVKPIESFVDNKRLSVQFFLSNLSKMLNKTAEEINSVESILTINMIVATTRELLLNTLTSLKKILEAMTNDDVRDMNDFYLSNYSTITISQIDNICGSKRLYDNEKGVEIRRSLAIISYVVLSSNYLGEYITGKRKLKVDEDYAYKHYIQQLKTYNSWSNKECDFEFLEMVLQFVTVIGLTRRAHQFCGVINAVALTLNNTQKSVGFCSTGQDYVSKIFRELVFSRPLLECIPAISEILMTFANCTKFSETLCVSPKSSTVVVKNGTWYFKVGPNTCPIEVFVNQINNLKRDPIIMINTLYAIVSFIKTIIPLTVLAWREERNDCKCCFSLIKFAVKSLYNCTKINIDNLEAKFQNLTISNNTSKMLDKDYWYKLKRKQKDIVIKGIQFLYDISIRESDYLLKSSNMANAFFLFFHHVKNMSDLRLPESDSDIFKTLEIVRREPAEKLAGSSQNLIYMNEKTLKLDNIDEKSKQKLIHRTGRECFNQNFSDSSSS